MMTPIQEQRLRQVKKEIVFLEKETRKKNVWFAFWFSAIPSVAGYLAGYLIEWALHDISLKSYLNALTWTEVLVSIVFWFLAGYFIGVRSIHQTLKAKRKEFAELKVKYGLTEEAVS